MPYATNDGVQIYYEIEGNGTPLLLHTGFMGSFDGWRAENTPYTEALRDRYQLILLEPRGQGRSDKPHDPDAYTRKVRAGDVLTVLDAVGVDRVHFWGYSMGGVVGFSVAALAPNRLLSLISGGANPYWDIGDPTEFFLYPWLQKGMDGFVEEWERELGPLPDDARELWLAEDAEALIASLRGVEGPEDVIAALPTMNVPTLLYAGTEDNPEPTERAAGVMPNATFVGLEGLDHGQGFERIDLVLPHVIAFLERVDQSLAPRTEA